VHNGEGDLITETLILQPSTTAQNSTTNVVYVQDIDFNNPVTINDFIFSLHDDCLVLGVGKTLGLGTTSHDMT
jgi:hypothetical protein